MSRQVTALNKAVQAIKLAKARVSSDIKAIKRAEAKLAKFASDLPHNVSITEDEVAPTLEKIWDSGLLKTPGKKFYVEIDLSGDARYIGPMNFHQAKLLKYYTENEAQDDSGNLELGSAHIVDEAHALSRTGGVEDPMGSSLIDYLRENQDFEDFLRNR